MSIFLGSKGPEEKAEEAVSPAEESIDLVGLEQTELVLLAPDEIGLGRGAKG